MALMTLRLLREGAAPAHYAVDCHYGSMRVDILGRCRSTFDKQLVTVADVSVNFGYY
jgi:hypothetical protein